MSASLSQRPRQKRPLLLPAGELADLPAGQIRQADLRQALAGPLPLLASRPAKPAQPAVGAHQHHVQAR